MRLYLFILFFSLLSCTGRNTNQVIHPTEDNLNPEFGISNVISDNDKGLLANSVIKDKIDNILNYREIGTIGKREGLSYEMLGNVKDIHVDETSNTILI